MLLYLILTFSTSNIIETHSLIHFHKRELQLRISSGTRIAPRIGRVLLLYLRLLILRPPTISGNARTSLTYRNHHSAPPPVRVFAQPVPCWQLGKEL